MATPKVQVPAIATRDSVQHIHRITRENRSLWYQLTVLQQPERARACGSGMTANSDRRPVDPPPVVELRIIEGPSVEEGKDITFHYNAKFFLYASLERARTIVHGRVQNAVATNPPILAGVPASGMAYLDRPCEAGYFIFPDLSVRHEGYFRLSFSLFETTGEEKDFDMEPANTNLPPGVDWRMEIKTQPFNVFSAKKFPGLMESTQLSRTVADQGCRVRIRRDVRMRKSVGKPSGFDHREEDFHRRTATAAPEDPHGIRACSLRYCDAALPPGRGGHLSFAVHPAPLYAASRQHPPPQSNGNTPPPIGPYRPPSHPIGYIKPEHNKYGYHRHARNTSSTYPSSAMSIQQEPSYVGAISNYVPPSPSTYSESRPRRDSHHSYPLTPLLPQPPRQSSRPLLKIVALVSPYPLPPIEAQTEPTPIPPLIPTGGKRKQVHVFAQRLHPLHNGQGQRVPHYGRHRGMTPEPDQGIYSRADGKIGVVQFNHCQ